MHRFHSGSDSWWRLAGISAASLLIVSCGTGGSGSEAKEGGAEQSEERTQVTLAMNPGIISYLPFFVALEEGYFEDEGLDVQVESYQGSYTTQLPSLARGDFDVMPVGSGPAIFTQVTEGFNIPVVAAMTQAEPGYLDTVALVVDESARNLDDPADLHGLRVDGAAEGSPIDFLVQQTLQAGKLGPSDITLSYRGRTPADMTTTLEQDAVDVQGMVEPAATLAEQQGIGTRWLSFSDVIPWFQESLLGMSPGFVENERDTAVAFLRGYLRAVEDIAAAGEEWTPALLSAAEKWTTLPKDVLQALGGVPYAPRDGAVSLESLKRSQNFWAEKGLVKTRIDLAQLVDSSLVEEAGK